MPNDRSERRRGSKESYLRRRSRSPTRVRDRRLRVRDRRSRRSSAERNTSKDRSDRGRSKRSTSRTRLEVKSRSRSVVIPPQQVRSSYLPPVHVQMHEAADRIHNEVRSGRRRHRSRSFHRENTYRSRSPIRSCNSEPNAFVTPGPSTIDANCELLKCIKESLQTISALHPQNKERFTNNNVVPEFDPKAKNQTIDTWLNKVKECSEIYGWDSKQTVHYALPKLVGTAKNWYEGQPSVLFTWDEWVEKLKSAFPSYENYGHLLTEMLAKRAKFGDDLEEYYYEKLVALNRCGIVGRSAIDCIVYGIDDRSVRYGAEAVGFEDADKLLGYLRGVKHERLDRFKRNPIGAGVDTSRKSVKNDPKILKCFNCSEIGHMVSGCRKPIIKCRKCRRIGHDDPECIRNVLADKAEVKML